MASKSRQSYSQRAEEHSSPLMKKLFGIAETKKTNVVLSADLTTTKELLEIADRLGPYIAVLKTHIDIISDFGPATIEGLTQLAHRHNFLLFEDRKFIDIGNTVQKQYRGGALRIYEWAHIINASILAGEGIIQALDQTIHEGDEPERGILILAEMTSKGSLAVGEYTRASVEIARKYPRSVLGFVATKELSSHSPDAAPNEDFVVFTTGVNLSSKGDALGQQYQTPTTAMAGGSDFLIAGRGIYAAADPVSAVKEYQKAGWDAYLRRTTSASE
ncbi:orotidine 5'-phosphate decarboxylase [Exophiala dermatitidis]|uniref:Orotidine 5'-phosphate decarboxylase n=2 Tax=Exophiala dermatitidis TaxID=5970 RepID=H6C6Y4_EXODN|nr:orotidine 5'-phosphate decarboxylase [Exophiala dermatitidis NIH/UT8656]KAJ4522753.1 orotidine 5'-phosphate decarboxylase [Exophiala dermatitidis]EHY59480.1 orotidine 5'-phosphate decarboxylase [Exophiala dermatitidis NIH/UT8656]KAJ4526057.1 orotidine 5'-phosphate decarboxylase [Exophiala dermatitidis]KAJ4526997.1 orotidine 5'-phosphate decarboxylase [Exophiala dermatitidis]KAJ4532713.1 orotidine 5'-phosphate decarboxylase [Exophiala dermatitidis]